MQEDSYLPFELPAVSRKKVSVAFDGGMLSSDAGVLVLRDVEKRLGLWPDVFFVPEEVRLLHSCCPI